MKSSIDTVLCGIGCSASIARAPQWAIVNEQSMMAIVLILEQLPPCTFNLLLPPAPYYHYSILSLHVLWPPRSFGFGVLWVGGASRFIMLGIFSPLTSTIQPPQFSSLEVIKLPVLSFEYSISA